MRKGVISQKNYSSFFEVTGYLLVFTSVYNTYSSVNIRGMMYINAFKFIKNAKITQVVLNKIVYITTFGFSK